MLADPYIIAERWIEQDECQRAVVGLAYALRIERKLSTGQHGAILLEGLTAGRRGCEATREWMAKLRTAQPVQARLL